MPTYTSASVTLHRKPANGKTSFLAQVYPTQLNIKATYERKPVVTDRSWIKLDLQPQPDEEGNAPENVFGFILSEEKTADKDLYPDYVTYMSDNKGHHGSVARMRIRFYGYDSLTLVYSSYAETNYDYIMLSKPDKELPQDAKYTHANVQFHTRGKQTADVASVAAYTDIEKYAEHFIDVLFIKDNSQSANDDRGYIAVPTLAKPTPLDRTYTDLTASMQNATGTVIIDYADKRLSLPDNVGLTYAHSADPTNMLRVWCDNSKPITDTTLILPVKDVNGVGGTQLAEVPVRVQPDGQPSETYQIDTLETRIADSSTLLHAFRVYYIKGMQRTEITPENKALLGIYPHCMASSEAEDLWYETDDREYKNGRWECFHGVSDTKTETWIAVALFNHSGDAQIDETPLFSTVTTISQKGEPGEPGQPGAPGEPGKPGYDGCIIRLSEWEEGKQYRNDSALTPAQVAAEFGGDPTRYIDEVVVSTYNGGDGSSYLCRTTHTATTDNKPRPDTTTAQWNILNNLAPLRTPYAHIDRALVQYLQVQQITLQHQSDVPDGSYHKGDIYGAIGGSEQYPLWFGGDTIDKANAKIGADGSVYFNNGYFNGSIQARNFSQYLTECVAEEYYSDPRFQNFDYDNVRDRFVHSVSEFGGSYYSGCAIDLDSASPRGGSVRHWIVLPCPTAANVGKTYEIVAPNYISQGRIYDGGYKDLQNWPIGVTSFNGNTLPDGETPEWIDPTIPQGADHQHGALVTLWGNRAHFATSPAYTAAILCSNSYATDTPTDDNTSRLRVVCVARELSGTTYYQWAILEAHNVRFTSNDQLGPIDL